MTFPRKIALLQWIFISISAWEVSALLALLAVSAESVSTWKLLRGDITEYKRLATLKADSKIDCLSSSRSAEAHAASFDAASGDCALLVCDRGSADGCRKCRHDKDPSLPMLWLKNPSESCWTTFQHRVDGSVSFNRTWSEYANGFGQGESLNYWMGLEQLHQITATGVWRVRWEFSDWNGTWYWAENAPFSVGSAADKYRASMGPLDSNRSSVGQLTNPSWSPNNQQFSTPEVDNDLCPCNCAQERSAGWWFGWCTFINPNGVYLLPPAAFGGGGMYYYLFDSGPVLTSGYSMKTFECMIQQ